MGRMNKKKLEGELNFILESLAVADSTAIELRKKLVVRRKALLETAYLDISTVNLHLKELVRRGRVYFTGLTPESGYMEQGVGLVRD